MNVSQILYLNVDHSRTRSRNVQSRSQQQSAKDEGKETAIHEGAHVGDAVQHAHARFLERVEKSKGEGA